MKWILEQETNSLTYKEYNGAYGYSIMPYKTKYALYFHNAWRNNKPLGEYITTDAENSNVYAEPSLGLRDNVLFANQEEAKIAAEKHRNAVDYEKKDVEELD